MNGLNLRTLNHKRRPGMWILIILAVIGFASVSQADSSVPGKKQTTLKLYVNALEAYKQWAVSPETIHILDVRTPAEYIFIGHAPMAVNVPVKLLEDKVNPLTLNPGMSENGNFVKAVSARFKKSDTIMVMCRSGARSAAAVNLMAKAGFQKVYNIIDGFEGDALKDADSYQDGKRIINGWKNSGAPWTYKLERGLVYNP